MTPADFWVRTTISETATTPVLNAQIAELTDRLRDRGCTWLRVTDRSEEGKGVLYLEGWTNRPEVEAPFDAISLGLERQV